MAQNKLGFCSLCECLPSLPGLVVQMGSDYAVAPGFHSKVLFLHWILCIFKHDI